MLKREQPRRRFWYVWRRPETVASEVDEELNFHLEMRMRELTAGGMSAAAARDEALRRFGDLEYTRRYCREQDFEKDTRLRRGLMFEDLVHDVRVCFRSLLRAPIMAITILATVGLGIAASTVIFSAVDAALLRPLPYRDPEQLVRIYTDTPPNRFPLSLADYLALETQQTHFARIAAYTDRAMAFSDGAVSERLRGREVSWTYFGLLGAGPVLGRDFTKVDGQAGMPPTVIVSSGFWRRHLGGRPDVIGRPIQLDAKEHTLVGVLGDRVGPLEQAQDLFVPAQWDNPARKGPFLYTALGRLRQGVDRSAAADELRAINGRIFPLWRASYQDEKATWAMMDLKAHVVGDMRTTAGVALAAVGLVWLIACTNASNLLIARAMSRRRELAIRSALGASRVRVVRYLLVESGLLGLGAASVGVVLAWIGVRLLRDLGAAYFPRNHEIAFDGPVVSVFFTLTAVSALLFGLVPALHGVGGPVGESLRSLGRSTTGSPAVRRTRGMLVGIQFAIATPLAVVAALLLASLNELGRVELGFDSHNLISGSISLPTARYPDPGRVAAFWDELQRRVAAIPAVSDVAFTDGRPPQVGTFNNFDLEDSPTPSGQSQPVAPWLSVTPEYFRLLGLPLLEGRLLDHRDGLAPEVEVVVVDRAWAKRFFPAGGAVGKRFREGGCTTCPWTNVVGVVGDVKYASLNRPDEGAVYAPMPSSARARYVVLRTSIDSATVLPAVVQLLRELDASVPFSSVATIDDLIARSLERPRSLTLVVGGFGILALILSSIGIYGVMSYYVQQHTKDISVRLALGGSPGAVLRLILAQGMRIVVIGVAIGLLTALALTHMMASLLFRVCSTDPFTFAAVSVLVLAAAFVACWVPARRATGLQPAVLLRNE